MDTATAVSGIFAIILIVLGIILAIAWIFLPFLILGKMNKLIALQEKANYELGAIHHYAAKADGTVLQ